MAFSGFYEQVSPERAAFLLSTLPDQPSAFSAVGKNRGDGTHFTGTCPRLAKKGKTGLERGIHRWDLRDSQKGGEGW